MRPLGALLLSSAAAAVASFAPSGAPASVSVPRRIPPSSGPLPSRSSGIRTVGGRPSSVLAEDRDVEDAGGLEAEAEAAEERPDPADADAECAALLPGQVLTVRLGDVESGRKAWKKRRRSGSPILVPCRVLDVGREGMVRRNVAHLLHKYGEATGGRTGKDRAAYERIGGGEGGGHGVALTVRKMCRLYERDLGGSLMDHANALGYDRVGDLLLHLFDDSVKKEHGVELITGLRDNLLLVSSLPRRRARELSRGACLARFAPSPDDARRMVHVGKAKVRARQSAEAERRDDGDGDRRRGPPPRFADEPLSAEVRVSQRDADGGRVSSGEVRRAFVLSYDRGGGGAGRNNNAAAGAGAAGEGPLLTLAVDPPRGLVRDQMKRRQRARRYGAAREAKVRRLAKSRLLERGVPERDLADLKIGDGPIDAAVVAVSGRAGAAFVDCGVGRRRGKKRGGGTARVLGMLRFDDVVQRMMEDEVHRGQADAEGGGAGIPGADDDVMAAGGMTEEDAGVIEAALLGMDEDEDEWGDDEDDEDGAMTVEDLFMSSDDEDWDDEGEDDESDEDVFEGMGPEERLRAIANMLQKDEEDDSVTDIPVPVESLSMLADESTRAPPSSRASAASSEPAFLSVGDEVKVYIRAVFPQSGRFMVTLDPSVQGRKAKDMKRERTAEKRMSKLADKMGGGEGLGQILELVGTECDGTVKARSKTGNWYYVQPILDGDDSILPVGVATPEEGTDNDGEGLKSGDRVRVCLEGIDEKRGQLAMKLLQGKAP